MGTPRFLSFALLAVAVSFFASSSNAQLAPAPASTARSPSPGTPSPAGPLAPEPIAAPAGSVATSTADPTRAVVAGPAVDPKSAVESVLAMFALNLAVKVDATDKPLPANGTWGAQTQFPTGLPHACALARVPCVKVIYRVPEANIVCDWTLGLVTVAVPQPDGTMKHVTQQLVLDENDAAARYTLRKSWASGEAIPKPSFVQRSDYPTIAANANVAGTVTVRLVIGPDGLVKSATPLAGPALLQPAAVEAARQWKFEPLAIGHQPTSFQLDERFGYTAGKTDFSASMDPSGKVIEQETDSRLGVGFRSDGASSGNWQTCSATGCANAAPATPK